MNKDKKTALIEALNYIIRQFFFTFLGLLALILGKLILGIDLNTGVVAIEWMLTFNLLKAATLFSVLTAVIGGIDKFKHIFAKEENPKDTKGKSMGIVPAIMQIQK